MPEPVITLISGVTAIVTNVWRVSKDLYDIIEGIRNAPAHVRIIMDDVNGLYIVLGALQGLLPNVDANHLRTDLVPVFESLQLNLDSCCSILIELSRKLIRYTNAAGQISMSNWMAFRFQFKEKNVQEFRGYLTAYKMTVQLAISTANFANSTQSLNTNERIGTEIKQMRAQVDEIAFNQEFLGRSEIADHGSVTSQDTDPGFALRRFLMTTESVLSVSPPESPKMTGIREGSVSPPLLRLRAQPAGAQRVSTGSMRIRDDGSGSSSTDPFSRGREPTPVRRTRIGDIKVAGRRASRRSMVPQEDIEVLESTNKHQRQDGFYQENFAREEQEGASFCTSPPPLANFDEKDDYLVKHGFHQSRYHKSTMRPSKSSGPRRLSSNAQPADTKVTLSSIQESAPAILPTYASVLNEGQVEQSQEPSSGMEGRHVRATNDKITALDDDEACNQKSVEALPRYHPEIQSIIDHFAARDTQRRARDEELLLMAMPAAENIREATKSEIRRVQKLVDRNATPSQRDSIHELPQQETEKRETKPETLSRDPLAGLSDAPAMATPYELGEAAYRNRWYPRPLDESSGETQIDQDTSIVAERHVTAGNEQIGNSEERIHIGDNVDAKNNSYALPPDGKPITIDSRRFSGDSQTSLLIEYFEGGKAGKSESRRPSVRVRVAPSSKNRKSNSDNPTQITSTKHRRPSSNISVLDTEKNSTRKPRYTKRIVLSPGIRDKTQEGDREGKNTVLSQLLEVEEPNPVSRIDSPLEGKRKPRRVEIPSERPAVAATHPESNHQPRDCLLDEQPSSKGLNILNKLPPTLQVDSPEYALQETTGKARTEEPVIRARRSFSSRSSIQNPKLLETVENAIQNLILPELNALKRDQMRRLKQERDRGAIDVTSDKSEAREARHKRRSKTTTQAAEQSESRDRSRPPLPALTGLRAYHEAARVLQKEADMEAE